MTVQHTNAYGWERIARRIRVPLGFVAAAVYVVEVVGRPAHPAAIAWSLALVLPGLALRAIASGTVKKNRELTVSGPYAYTRNPLYLGSTLIAAGFALALLSWPIAVLLAVVFAVIYVPVIASEERFLRTTFPEFDAYCRSVPRFLPRLTPARSHGATSPAGVSHTVTPELAGGFSFELYLQHREYNAAIGAVLLYLCLLYLQPVVQSIVHHIG
jgi:protein-S-isoprenylcysteine O-methyltransferase Ste14